MNILTQRFNTKYNTAPFSKIKNEDYLPAIIRGIEKAKAEIDAIVNNSEDPTFENTIVAMEFTGDTLDRASSVFFNLNSAETSDEMQKIAQEVSPLLSEFGNDVRLNGALFAKVKAVYDQKKSLDLSIEQATLLEKKYKSFSRNGANLSEDKKSKLREIDLQLSKLSLQFGENVLAETLLAPKMFPLAPPVIKLPTVTLPVADIIPAVSKFPPVMLAVALTSPPVKILPPVILAALVIVLVALINPAVKTLPPVMLAVTLTTAPK
jgi:Zn-dependent oligopeptidase